MGDLTYHSPVRILFGDHALDQLSDPFREFHVSSLLLIYSGDFIKELGTQDAVRKACVQSGIAFYEEGDVVPNPKTEFVRELIILGKGKKIDFVPAVGGGNSIDTVKAVAAGIPHEYDVWDFFECAAVPETAVLVGVITTIPANGSECSNCSIISNGLHKYGVEYDRIIPKFAVMNSEYTRTLPACQTSAGITDILSHMLERYPTSTEHVDTTDYMLEGTMRALAVNAHRLMKRPDDIHARSEVQHLASIVHNNLLDISRESDRRAHRIGHELSAQCGITHGESMIVVTIAWARYMAAYHPDKLAQLADRIFGVDPFVYTEEDMTYILADRLEEFFQLLHLKTTLHETGIDDAHFEGMANRAASNGKDRVGHYVALNEQIFVDMLKMALQKSFVITNIGP